MKDGYVEMAGVMEYGERMAVELYTQRPGDAIESDGDGRACVVAHNESGYNSTAVDLMQLLSWVKNNRPDLWSAA